MCVEAGLMRACSSRVSTELEGGRLARSTPVSVCLRCGAGRVNAVSCSLPDYIHAAPAKSQIFSSSFWPCFYTWKLSFFQNAFQKWIMPARGQLGLGKIIILFFLFCFFATCLCISLVISCFSPISTINEAELNIKTCKSSPNPSSPSLLLLSYPHTGS